MASMDIYLNDNVWMHGEELLPAAAMKAFPSEIQQARAGSGHSLTALTVSC